jgi:hypothetical protein
MDFSFLIVALLIILLILIGGGGLVLTGFYFYQYTFKQNHTSEKIFYASLGISMCVFGLSLIALYFGIIFNLPYDTVFPYFIGFLAGGVLTLILLIIWIISPFSDSEPATKKPRARKIGRA